MNSTPVNRPAGTLIELDGRRRLHVSLRGTPTTAPTVVFESGLASPLQVWEWVRRSLPSDVTTLAYERAGCGWSDPGPGPRSVPRIADDLEAVLAAAGVTGPIVLVGHSFGGLIARHLAGRRPQRVTGMVLVDALHPWELRRSATQRRGMAWLEQSLKLSALRATLGLARRRADEQFSDLPAEAAHAARAQLHRGAFWRAATSELVAWKNGDPELVEAQPLGEDIPLGVVISGESLRNDVAHQRLQQDFLTWSRQAFAVPVREAGHFDLVLDARWAATVAETVTRVLAQPGELPAARAAEGADDGR